MTNDEKRAMVNKTDNRTHEEKLYDELNCVHQCLGALFLGVQQERPEAQAVVNALRVLGQTINDDMTKHGRG
jgi:hypothetical protein